MANGRNRKIYNNEILCRKIGITPNAITEFAKNSALTRPTIVKALNGEINIGLNHLITIIEESGADFYEVFDKKFYLANKTATN